MKKAHLFVIGCMILNVTFTYSQEILTWEECVRRAKAEHPDLISAAEKVKQTKADRDIAISAILPQLDSELSAGKSKAAGKKAKETYSYSVSGRQLVFDGFKSASGISGSLKTVTAQEYDYAVVSSNIRLNLKSAFAELLKAQELISLTEDIAGRRSQNLRLVTLRYEAGREHKGSLLTAKADMAQAEFEVSQAKRSSSLARRQLLKEMGINKMEPVEVSGDFSIRNSYDDKPDFEYLADTTPFLRELIAKKEAARYDFQSAQSDFFPEVYLNASAGRTSADWPPEGDDWSAGGSVSFPLFEGGSRIAEVSKAKSKLRQAEADERSGRDSVLVTLEKTWKDLKDAIANVSVKEKFMEAAKERAKIASAQYETGLASFNDWVIIEDNLVNARKAYLNAQKDMLVSEAYWIQAIGGTLAYEEE